MPQGTNKGGGDAGTRTDKHQFDVNTMGGRIEELEEAMIEARQLTLTVGDGNSLRSALDTIQLRLDRVLKQSTVGA
jgi:hypothetical protein